MADLLRADVRAYLGATGSGKGASILRHLSEVRPVRLAVFDPMHEYGRIAVPVSTALDAVRAMQARAFRVAWQPVDGTDFEGAAFKAEFALWCRACFVAGDLTMLVEELELVTRASWAPAAWRSCTKRGRHRRLRIIASTQRPADCDKAFLSSCTYVRCFALREHEDRQRVARAIDVPLASIEACETVYLSPTKTRITYHERDFSTGENQTKTVTLTR